MEEKDRLHHDIRFLRKAYLVAKDDSTCLRRKVGAILVNENGRILSTGFNGAPRKYRHCVTVGCIREKLNIPSGERMELCVAQHAEHNAMLFYGESPGATVYIYGGTPCKTCAGAMINNGIVRVVCDRDYPDDMAKEMLRDCGVELVVLQLTDEQLSL